MNKKKLALPIITLVLSVIAGTLMLVFTTSFVYNFYENRSFETPEYKTKIDKFEVVKRSGKFAQTAYKIEPNYSNLFAVKSVYDLNYAVHCGIFPDDDNNIADYLNKMPSDFTEKSVEYSKKYYDYLFEHYDQKKEYDSLADGKFMSFSIGNLPIELIFHYSDYITALYLNGQKDEVRRLVDEVLNNCDSYEHAYYIVYGLEDFVYLVHNTETDKDFQKWMLDAELRLTEEYNKKAVKEYQYENFFAREIDGIQFYKPFE